MTGTVAAVAVGMKLLEEGLCHTQHSPKGSLLLGEWYEQPEAEQLNAAARPLPYGFDCTDSTLQKVKSNPFHQVASTCCDGQ